MPHEIDWDASLYVQDDVTDVASTRQEADTSYYADDADDADAEGESKDALDFAQIIGGAQDTAETMLPEREAELARQAQEDARAKEALAKELEAARRERSPDGASEYAGWVVRFRRFNLEDDSDVKLLEEIMTGALEGTHIPRGPERYSSDDRWVTLSWLEQGAALRKKKQLKKKAAEEQRQDHTDPDTGKPYLIQPPYANPVPRGAYPGDGVPDPS